MPENVQVQAEPEERHIIWSDVHLEFREDLIATVEEDYPGLTNNERAQIMYENNSALLEDVRMALDIELNYPIIVFMETESENYRFHEYDIIKSGSIKECLYPDGDMSELYVDGNGDFRCDDYHREGTNHYLYRVVNENATEDQLEDLFDDIYLEKDCTAKIAFLTDRIGDEIGKVYGWEFGNESVTEPPPDIETDEPEL